MIKKTEEANSSKYQVSVYYGGWKKKNIFLKTLKFAELKLYDYNIKYYYNGMNM